VVLRVAMSSRVICQLVPFSYRLSFFSKTLTLTCLYSISTIDPTKTTSEVPPFILSD